MRNILLLFVVLLLFNQQTSRANYNDELIKGFAYSSSSNLQHELKLVKYSLPKLHLNLFDNFDSDYWNDSMNTIILMSSHDENKAVFEVQRLVSELYDSHTRVKHFDETFFPFELIYLDGKYYINKIERTNSNLLLKEVIEINQVPIKDVIDEVKVIVPHESEYFLNIGVTKYLQETYIYKTLKLSNGNALILTLLVNGNPHYYVLNSVVTESGNLDTQPDIIRYANSGYRYKRYDENYWNEIIDNNVCYINFNRSYQEEYSLEEFEVDLLRDINYYNVDKLIIDLRNNNGGERLTSIEFVKMIKDTNIDNIYVLISNRTYSAGMVTAFKLKELNAILVGEPTGQSPNFNGAVAQLNLTYDYLDVTYSREYVRLSENDLDSLYPDIYIPYTYENYRDWTDDAIDWVLHEVN